MKDIARNKKAFFDYAIEDKFEAGIVLVGTEVKALRQGRATLQDSYVIIRGGEAELLNCNIAHYEHGNIQNHEPTRTRKLLMHKREIEKLASKVSKKGYSLIPLRLYFKGSRAKVEVGLARGKKFFEKRESIKEREAKKDIDRALKSRNR